MAAAHPSRLDDGAYAAVRAAFPGLDVPASAFVAERVPDHEMSRRHLADLYLACGCDRSDPVALAALEHRGLARIAPSADDRRELIQTSRCRLDPRRGGGEGPVEKAEIICWVRCTAAALVRRIRSRCLSTPAGLNGSQRTHKGPSMRSI